MSAHTRHVAAGELRNLLVGIIERMSRDSGVDLSTDVDRDDCEQLVDAITFHVLDQASGAPNVHPLDQPLDALAEITFRAGFRAARESLALSEDEAWQQALAKMDEVTREWAG